MFGPTKNCIQFFKIYTGAQLKPVFGGFKPRLKFIKFEHSLTIFPYASRTLNLESQDQAKNIPVGLPSSQSKFVANRSRGY